VPLKLLSNPKSLRFHVTTQAGEGTQAHSLWFLAIGDMKPEPCAFAPKVEAASVGGSARLKWSTSAKNPIGFYIYRRSDSDVYERITNIPVSEQEFTDSGVTTGKYYQYRVTAICENGSISEMSDVAGVLVKVDRLAAKIQIDKTVIDFGERFVTKNLCDGFTIKNLGPGAVDFRIYTSDIKLSATSDSLHIDEGQSKRVNVCITDNLKIGPWEQTVSIDTGDLKVIVPVKAAVVASSEGDKSIADLRIRSLVDALELTWSPPVYNLLNLTGYSVEVGEFYLNRQRASKKMTLAPDKTSLKLDGLMFTTQYRITIRPMFEIGPGLPSEVSGNPLPPSIYIIMKVGSAEAIVNGKAAKMPAKVTVDSKSGKAMVPFRFIAESLRCKVSYDQKTKAITMTQGYKTVILTVGSTKASIDGMKIDCNPAPVIQGGSTYVPVRFVADAFMAETTWDSSKKQIGIYFPPSFRP
jgi:hypothetical protein